MGKPVNKTLRIAAMSAGEEIGHVSGPIVTFRGNAAPLRSLVANIEPVQDLHGYDNPWPAGGGKNKFDVDKMVNTSDITISNGVIAVTGNAKNSTKKLSELADLTVGEAYILTANTTGSGNLIYLYGTGANVNWSFGTSKTITQEMLDALVFFYGGNGATSQISNFMIRPASVTDATFAPYSNECPISGWSEVNVWVKPTYDPTANPTATIQLGQTVYGGTLDVTNGVLTVDRAMVDMGTLDWGLSATSRFYNTSLIQNFKRATTSAERATGLVCSAYKPSSNLSFSDAQDDFSWLRAPISNAFDLMIKDTHYTTTAEFKAAMSGVQLVYELATPITIPLTPTQISTLAGQNVVWADCGDVDVEYIATGGEGGKLALLLRNRKELLIALRKGLTPAEAGLLNPTPLLGGFVRPGLSTDDEKEEDELI